MEIKRKRRSRMILAGAAAVLMLVRFAASAKAEEVYGPGALLPEDYTSPSYRRPAKVGPGVPAPVDADQPKYRRTDYFTAEVESPVVAVTEKYSYDQMVADIGGLSERYPGRMRINEIGSSLDGRVIHEIVIGNPDAEKHILIHAGIHAREYMMPLLNMKQLEYGLHFYDSGSYAGRALRDMFEQAAIHYVPMVNPDGITISQFGTAGIRSDVLRQRIIDCYQADFAACRTAADFECYLTLWKANARGVDLNQNFPANWDLVTTTTHPSYATYKGEAPLSEPESQALANLTNSRSWAVTISYHSMGNVIYWDYEGSRVSAESWNLANLLSDNTGYRLYPGSGHGGYKDWVQVGSNPIPSLTIETGTAACPLPLDQYEPIWDANKMVWAEAAKYAIEH